MAKHSNTFHFQTKVTKLTNHMLELRTRIAYVFISSMFSFLMAYWKSTQLIYIFLLSFSFVPEESSIGPKGGFWPSLPFSDSSASGWTLSESDYSSPLRNGVSLQKNFIFTDVYEAFSSQVFVCLIACLLCVMPFLVYQLLCFFLPSWHTYEKQIRCKHILIMLSCWILYVCAVHSIVIPKLCGFLLQFQIEKDCLAVTVEPKIVSYVSWSANLLLYATLLFFLACALYFYTFYGIIRIEGWGKKRKSLIFVCLLLASLISPPEVWSQSFLVLVLFLICEFFIWLHLVYYYIQKRR